MKEIGGYFGLDKLVSNEYYPDLVSVNNGRNALLYLIEAKKIQKVYIPHYLCDSVSGILERTNFPFEYYHVDSKFIPIFEKELNSDEYLYVVNLFGQLTDDQAKDLKSTHGNIIFDNTHAFFQKPIEGLDTIYSVRKFFGVSDGAYISTASRLESELEMDVSKDRMEHILGRFEGVGSEYYQSFHKNDEVIDREPLKRMSRLTKNLLGAIDYEEARRTRNKNFSYLNNRLKESNGIQPVAPDGPFAYPFYVENGIELRKQLASKKIYIPTLWPNVIEGMPVDSVEYRFAANILPLPCDQRYDEENMAHMADILFGKIDGEKESLATIPGT
jgi:hypothetical protein